MKIALGCDHGGYELKLPILAYLAEEGYRVVDVGCNSTDSVNYPDYADKLCNVITSGKADIGILICGTGIGMSMAANKVKGIRAAVCTDPKSTEFTRRHNDANVLCLGARIIDEETAENLVKIFLTTEFEGGKHLKRISMFS